jgi:hypothetical protein
MDLNKRCGRFFSDWHDIFQVNAVNFDSRRIVNGMLAAHGWLQCDYERRD